MTENTYNSLGQPIGLPVHGWQPPPLPTGTVLQGRYCRVERLDAALHAPHLYSAYRRDTDNRLWTYLAAGPFDSEADFTTWAEAAAASADPYFYAIVDAATERAVGIAAYLRIAPQSGSIEVGHLMYSPLLQRTPAATEAMFLMMKHAFELGYRRYEWKCDALNAPSRAAAQRLGFSYEGIFRQATVYKGRNRDTAWYAVIDKDWQKLQEAYLQWLDPANFDESGSQRTRLSELTAPLLTTHGADQR